MTNYNVLTPMLPITCAVIDSSYIMKDNPDPVTIHIPFNQINNVVNAFNDAFDTIEDTVLDNVNWTLLGSSGSFDVFGQRNVFGNVMFEFGFDMEMIEDWEYNWRIKYNDAVYLVKYLEKIAF